jgi:hypothetical protein
MRIVSGDHADELRPVLKWIKAEAPRKKERINASKILTKLEGLKKGRENWKQIMIHKGEADLLDTISKAFPPGSVIGEGGKQLDFFGKFEED